MEYYYYTLFFTLFLLVIMLSIIFYNQTMMKDKRKAFLVLYFLLGIAIFCEWLTVWMNGVAREDIILIHKIAKATELSITPMFSVIYAQTIFAIPKRKRNHLDNLPILLLAIHTIFEFLSIPFDWVFGIDRAGYFYYADWYNLFIITFALTAFYFFQQLFWFSKYYQNTNGIVIVLVVFFIITGMIIQFLNTQIQTTCLTLGMASVFVYLYYTDIHLYIDYLTQLLNQRSYKLYLEYISFPVTIVLFDVDSFKEINDTHTHHYGDMVLNKIGNILKEVYGNFGKCYRIGGDEFCVILTRYEANELLQTIFLERISETRKQDPRFPHISIGSAHFVPGYQDISDIIKQADKNLYACKKKRKEPLENNN